MANKIRLARGEKERIEEIKKDLLDYELVYSTDTKELGVKNENGDITYIGVTTELNWGNILKKPTFATVATSGKYEDLSGIPDEYELTKEGIETALVGFRTLGGVTAIDSIQLGKNAKAEFNYSTALGYGAKATNENSIALGDATAAGYVSTAIGQSASAYGDSSAALGYDADAGGDYSTALGYEANAEGHSSIALGSATATHEQAIALGNSALSGGDYALALGVNATALGYDSIALGHSAKAEGENSIAIGTGTEVTEKNVVDFGSARQVRVNETPKGNRDAASKKYVDDNAKLKLDKDFSALPAQANPLLTDVLVLNREKVTQKVTLANLLALVDTEIFVVASALPTTGVVNKIYLVPSDDPESIDNYIEWIWHDDSWERLGGFTLDLSNYYNKTQVDTKLVGKLDVIGGTATDLTVSSGFQTPKITGVDGGGLYIESESGMLDLKGESGITASAFGTNIIFQDMESVNFNEGSFYVDAYDGEVLIESGGEVRVIADGSMILEGSDIEIQGASKFTGIPTPTEATGAVNKSYVDSFVIDGGDL